MEHWKFRANRFPGVLFLNSAQADDVPAEGGDGDAGPALRHGAPGALGGVDVFGVRLGVHGLHVVMVEGNVLFHGQLAEGAQVDFQLEVLRHIPVDAENADGAVLL